MDFNRFTEKLQEAIRAAQAIAVQHGNQQIDTEHLMLALLDQEGGLAPSILNKADIRLDALRTREYVGKTVSLGKPEKGR